ncbi:hypothetical protein [Paenibacillus sp. NEAU-GSW1]|uniref:hypothetical protein n=1 Tax=Paenibacillus sp. NEAU-GSW1 TaxID=2682486 RepID=UPI0012E22AEA|nr:hypothetical protein [Paenibacillus sp. NEAU-GSW1]
MDNNQRISPSGLPEQPSSFWLTSTEQPSFEPLSSDVDIDVCVVGGGITGINARLLACWDCPCHGSRFSYKDDVLEGPAKKTLRPIRSKNKRSVQQR